MSRRGYRLDNSRVHHDEHERYLPFGSAAVVFRSFSPSASPSAHRTIGWFDNTAARGGVTPECRVDHRCSTPDARLDGNRLCRTVSGASSALHAMVPLCNESVAVIHAEHVVGAHHQAHAAPNTLLEVQRQRDHIPQIQESFHLNTSLSPKKGGYPYDQTDPTSTDLERYGPPHLFPDTRE